MTLNPKTEPQQEAAWVLDMRKRLPSVWARTPDVAAALNISALTVRELCAAEEIVGIDYGRSVNSAWLIYVPSVIDFMKRRQGGKNK